MENENKKKEDKTDGILRGICETWICHRELNFVYLIYICFVCLIKKTEGGIDEKKKKWGRWNSLTLIQME